ncbi:MAG: hypothetical protein HY982_00530 [Candidatus Magasanikbacteria bacterium]|nr:hypothetical protein [Candidatus Magasanikbacteria bacterium]
MSIPGGGEMDNVSKLVCHWAESGQQEEKSALTEAQNQSAEAGAIVRPWERLRSDFEGRTIKRVEFEGSELRMEFVSTELLLPLSAVFLSMVRAVEIDGKRFVTLVSGILPEKCVAVIHPKEKRNSSFSATVVFKAEMTAPQSFGWEPKEVILRTRFGGEISVKGTTPFCRLEEV